MYCLIRRCVKHVCLQRCDIIQSDLIQIGLQLTRTFLLPFAEYLQQKIKCIKIPQFWNRIEYLSFETVVPEHVHNYQ